MKVQAALVSAVITLALTSCEQLPGVVNEAKREVRRNLIDPTSAQFDAVHVNSQSGAVCGLVNAKNRMGAYVGASPFVYESSTGATLVQEPPTEREFERFFDMIKYSEPGDYMKLEGKCKSLALWEDKCGTPIYPSTNKYCLLVNDGKSMAEIYGVVKQSLDRY